MGGPTTKVLASGAFGLALLLVISGISWAAPTRDDLLKRRGFTWKTAETAHLRLHFEPESHAEKRIEDLKVWQEKAFARNLALLGVAEYSPETDIFIVGSRERMEQLIGSQTNGIAYGSTRVLVFVFGEKINASGSHELMHVMANNTWGMKPKPWLNEGFATYADDRWHGHGLHELGKFLLVEKKLIALEKLIDDFRGNNDMVAYPQAGSFVKFLYEKYGSETVKQLWTKGTAKDLARTLGHDIASLEKAWHQKLTEADSSKVQYKF